MRSLNECIDIHTKSLSAAEKSVIKKKLTDGVAEYRGEGYGPTESKVAAVKNALQVLRKEKAGIVSDILKQRTDLKEADFRKKGIKPVAKTGQYTQDYLTKSHSNYVKGATKSAKDKNVLVSKSKDKSGKGRTVLIQVSSTPVDTGTTKLADSYYDDLYNKREGYSRPQDFWEMPEWAANVAYAIPNTDLYVVRNVEEASAFLDSTQYDNAMISAMDANKHQIKEMLTGYEGKAIIGGYVDSEYFSAIKNAEFPKTLKEGIEMAGAKFRDGLDYVAFAGSKTIPRLELSKGCLHRCAFCTVEKTITERNPISIKQQANAFKDLDFELIYLNDKTFGQAENFEQLVNLNIQLKKQNPKFKGFIIQTTAPAWLKMSDEFIDNSDIKFVELGVESYNDDILRNIKKPHNTKLLDKAAARLREKEINFIPNIIVGLAGVKNGKLWTETGETYQNTLDFLERNKDIISHTNTYVLATYKGTELNKQLSTGVEADADENIINKSWLKDKEVHKKFYKDVLNFSKDALTRTPFSAEYDPSIDPFAESQKDYDQEMAAGKTMLAGKLKLKDILYYDAYEDTLAKEAKLLGDAQNIMFIGSGPMPISPMLLAKNHGKDVAGIDIDKKAGELGEKVAKSQGVDMPVFIVPGQEFEGYQNYDGVVLALEAGVTKEQKVEIFEKISEDALPDTKIIVRTSKDKTGAFPNVSEYVGDYFDVIKSVPTFDGYSKSLLLSSTQKYSEVKRRVKFSKKSIMDQTEDPDIKNTLKHIGGNRSIDKKVDDFKLSVVQRFTTQVADSLHPLAVLEKGKGIAAAMSGYKAMRMLSNFPAVLGSFLHNASIEFNNNWIQAKASDLKTNKGGLYTVVQKLGDTADMFFYRKLAKSAQEMLNKGRKHLFGKDSTTGEYLDDQKQIDNLMKLTTDSESTNSTLWADADARLREINKDVLDFAEKSGIIDAEKRLSWEREDYIPFYRIIEDWTTGDIETLFPKGAPKIGTIHMLKGSGKNVGDPLSNLTNAYAFLLNESMKNLARKKSIKIMLDTGLSNRAKWGEKGKNIVDIRHKGKVQRYRIGDKYVYDALTDLDQRAQTIVSKILTAPKHLLTAGVTLAPAFRVANLLRDTVHTAFMSNSFIPFFDSAKGFYHALADTDVMREYESTGGAFSGAYHQRDVIKGTTKEVEKLKKQLHKGKKALLNPMRLWDAWEKIGEASENAARVGLYMNLKKEGKSSFEAGYESKDLLDFHMSGKSKLMQLAIQTIPFLNARVQGLYKLGRVARQDKAAFLVKGTILALAAVALHAHNSDDERYRDLPNHEKLQYFNFFGVPGLGRVRIPIPFEVGAIFGTFPVAMTKRILDDKDNKELSKYLLDTLVDTFRIDFPQFMKPFIQQYANKDSFTGAPTVPLGKKGLDPELQVGARTTKVARAIGKGMQAIGAPDVMASPLRIDKFISDYTAYLGAITLHIADMGIEWIISYPEDPAVRVGDRYLSGIGRFIKGDDVPHRIKQEEAFYSMLAEADKAHKSYSAFKTTKEMQKAREYRKEKKGVLKSQKVLSKSQAKIRKINQKIYMIQISKTKSAEQKATLIDKQLERRHKLIKRAVIRAEKKIGG